MNWYVKIAAIIMEFVRMGLVTVTKDGLVIVVRYLVV